MRPASASAICRSRSTSSLERAFDPTLPRDCYGRATPGQRVAGTAGSTDWLPTTRAEVTLKRIAGASSLNVRLVSRQAGSGHTANSQLQPSVRIAPIPSFQVSPWRFQSGNRLLLRDPSPASCQAGQDVIMTRVKSDCLQGTSCFQAAHRRRSSSTLHEGLRHRIWSAGCASGSVFVIRVMMSLKEAI